MSQRKSPEELLVLKTEWLANPYWVLENTDGFDEHRAELRQFRLDTHARQEKSQSEQRIQFELAHDTEDLVCLEDFQIEFSANRAENNR